jgi:hypothetical protein
MQDNQMFEKLRVFVAWQDVLQQGSMNELEACKMLLTEYAGSLEAEAAARQQVISFLKAMLQQQVLSGPLHS